MKDIFFLQHIRELSSDNNKDHSSKIAANFVLENLEKIYRLTLKGSRKKRDLDLTYDLLLESGIGRKEIDDFLVTQYSKLDPGSDSEIDSSESTGTLPQEATDEEKIANRAKNSFNIANTIETLSSRLVEIVARVKMEAKKKEMDRLLLVRTANILLELSIDYSVSFEKLEKGKIPMLYLDSKHSGDDLGVVVTIRPPEEAEKERYMGNTNDALVVIITEKSSGNIITLEGDLNKVSIRHLINELNFKDLNHYFTPSRESEGLGASSGGAYGGGGEASAAGGGHLQLLLGLVAAPLS